jgi:alkaline phosphatase D
MDDREQRRRTGGGEQGRGITRRQLLRGSAMAMALGACGDNLAADRPDAGSGSQAPPPGGRLPKLFPDDIAVAAMSTFPLGVASGDVGAQAVLWTQYRGISELMLAVWEVRADESYGDLMIWQRVRPGGEGFTHVDVAGLSPGTPHVFAFVEAVDLEAKTRSALGRFRTAPALEALAPLRFGASSCTQFGFPMETIARAGARSDLELYLLLGDTMYSSSTRTLDGFRLRWARNLGNSAYRDLRQSTSVLATWDDHEVANNWDPETIEESIVSLASRTFFESLPIRRDARAPDRIYRSTRWGRTAEIFVLDSRSERRPSTRLRGDAQYLSRAQMDWLKSGMAASPCVFKVIMNSVPITNFPSVFDVAASDRWEGYWEARQELLSFIDGERIGGVLWLSGDFHFASAGRVSPSGPGSQAIEILVGPGAQEPNPLWAALVDDPQFDFASGANNYGVFDLDPASRVAKVTYLDENDVALATRSYTL